MDPRIRHLNRAIGLAAWTAGIALSGSAWADDASSDKQQIEALKQQVGEMLKKIEQLSSKQDAMAAQAAAAASAPPPPVASATTAAADSPLSTRVLDFLKNTEFYGNLDLSIDDTTKGLASSYPNGSAPVGRNGWMPGISTNLSYLGFRGRHPLKDDLDVVFQLETQVDVAATSGTSNNNSSNDSTVKGALTS